MISIENYDGAYLILGDNIYEVLLLNFLHVLLNMWVIELLGDWVIECLSLLNIFVSSFDVGLGEALV